eukprot:CAMPEP_0201544298 /NCGR_PEP_ID=MMETSP0173_2-20130828/880_1 /ASSEMBLY_ACC=CAM_ASM_000268 /TAXON_ID=218659 /ORGANISM="Vexillifera sp., Strain DIVA3 564/2" /LENGTH=860 /DNA_ID=CAMNT_0047952361 /DNA_START=264 /DNA_END=2846 /DNA_ORIENTATION=-
MAKNQLDDVLDMMKHVECIRNLSVIAHVDHGKSTLTDSLVAMAGLLREEDVGRKRKTDTRPDEQLRAITIKSTGVTLFFEIPEGLSLGTATDNNRRRFLVNLIDSPGHVDFSSEVSAALRVTDGSLVVVDCVSGVSVQTETVVQQSLAEQSKPALCINKLDRMFFEVQFSPEEQYQQYRRIIEQLNALIASVRYDGSWQVDPLKGSVAFTSGYYGWGFTLNTFARLYAKVLGTDEDRFLKKLWGDWFYDHETKKFRRSQTSPTGKQLKRAFNEFVIEPLQQVIKFSMEFAEKPKRFENKVLKFLNIKVSEKERDLCHGNRKEMVRIVLQRWIPAGPACRDVIIGYLPSPAEAQVYRAAHLYSGPQDDETAKSIRKCDPNGPLVFYCSKMIPIDDKGTRFHCFGRVFSGTIRPSQDIYIPKQSFTPPDQDDDDDKKAASSDASKKAVILTGHNAYRTKVQGVMIMMCADFENVTAIPAGNTCAIAGVEKFVLKTGSFLSSPNSYPLRNMTYSVHPVVRCAVECSIPSELPRLTEALRRLTLTDSIVQVTNNDSGEHVVAAAGELHMEIVLQDLQGFMTNCGPLRIGEPVVSYCETVSCNSKDNYNDRACLAKSPNKHNRLYITAEPLAQEYIDTIEEGDLSPIQKEFKRRLFCFGPEQVGANMLVDATTGVQNMLEIKEHCSAAFQWLTSEGALTEEPLRNIHFSIADATLHSDTIHRGGGQIIPACRRACLGAELVASPRLLEPVFIVEVTVPKTEGGGVYSTLLQNRGSIISEEPAPASPSQLIIKAHLPVASSFGITAKLRSATHGRAFLQMSFDHWDTVPGDPFKDGTLTQEVVNQIRKRKGLKDAIPVPTDFLDKL